MPYVRSSNHQKKNDIETLCWFYYHFSLICLSPDQVNRRGWWWSSSEKYSEDTQPICFVVIGCDVSRLWFVIKLWWWWLWLRCILYFRFIGQSLFSVVLIIVQSQIAQSSSSSSTSYHLLFSPSFSFFSLRASIFNGFAINYSLPYILQAVQCSSSFQFINFFKGWIHFFPLIVCHNHN